MPRTFVLLCFAVVQLLFILPALSAFAVTAAEYRRRADHAVATGHYDTAVESYRQEANIYDRLHDHNGAMAERLKAQRWASKIGIYQRSETDSRELPSRYFGAKYEPYSGCYVSAYVAGDPLLDKSYDGENTRSRPEVLGDLIHKHLAVVWDYCSYGSRFPINWARALTRIDISPEIAWEPNRGLNEVHDNEYLEQFARDASAIDGPVFLRFASEMNGDWTAYHGNAALYRAKFRLVHDVMARVAPNVVMIWCVNVVPEQNMADYYPGDSAVDWVGINMYSVLHHDNDPRRSAKFEHPADMLDYFTQHFGHRKPVAICEYAASHGERLSPRIDQSDTASVKYAELLNALPRSYPMVKMIGFYDANNLTGQYVRADRKLNNYCLSDSETILRSVRAGLRDSYYMSRVESQAKSSVVSFAPLPSVVAAIRDMDITLRVQTYLLRPRVQLQFDNKMLLNSSTPCQYDIRISASQLTPGPHTLHVTVRDSIGALISQKSVTIRASALP